MREESVFDAVSSPIFKAFGLRIDLLSLTEKEFVLSLYKESTNRKIVLCLPCSSVFDGTLEDVVSENVCYLCSDSE